MLAFKAYKAYMRQPSANYRLRKGFTLIEGIIAVGIISTALIVGLSLAYSNLTAAQANTDRLTAAQLAREGIEAVRHMRDSNWLRRDANIDKFPSTAELEFYAWDDFFDNWPDGDLGVGVPISCNNTDPAFTGQTLDDCGNYFDVLMTDFTFSDPLQQYVLEKAASPTDAIGCIASGQVGCQVRKQGSVYYQSLNADPGTVFYRRITLKPICNYDPGSGYIDVVEFDPALPDMHCDDGPNPEKVGVLVTSQVAWQRGNKTLEVQAKERMYNWRE